MTVNHPFSRKIVSFLLAKAKFFSDQRFDKNLQLQHISLRSEKIEQYIIYLEKYLKENIDGFDVLTSSPTTSVKIQVQDVNHSTKGLLFFCVFYSQGVLIVKNTTGNKDIDNFFFLRELLLVLMYCFESKFDHGKLSCYKYYFPKDTKPLVKLYADNSVKLRHHHVNPLSFLYENNNTIDTYDKEFVDVIEYGVDFMTVVLVVGGVHLIRYFNNYENRKALSLSKAENYKNNCYSKFLCPAYLLDNITIRDSSLTIRVLGDANILYSNLNKK